MTEPRHSLPARCIPAALAACLLLAGLAERGRAQTVEWVRQLGTNRSDFSRGVAADALGNVYITGDSEGSLGGHNPFPGVPAVFVAKYDSAGSLQWTRQLRDGWDYGYDVSADGLGNIYVTGMTHGSLGGPSAGIYDVFVVKYDAAGDLLWLRQFGTPDEEYGLGVSADGLGNVFITGMTRGSLGGPNAGSSDGFVAKYDAAGDLQWTRQFGTSTEDYSSGVSADGLGNVYLSGFTYGNLGGPNAGAADAFAAKIVDRLPGDFDGNGVTDGGDFLAWQRGESPNPLSAADLAAWQANFGAGAATAAAGVVPEPTGLALAAGPLALVALARRQVCRRLVVRRT